MTRRSKNDNTPVNQNWIKTENLKQWKHNAIDQAEKRKVYESMFDVVYVPHPTLRKTWVQKLILKSESIEKIN